MKLVSITSRRFLAAWTATVGKDLHSDELAAGCGPGVGWTP